MSSAVLSVVTAFCPVLVTITGAGIIIGIVLGAFYGK